MGLFSKDKDNKEGMEKIIKECSTPEQTKEDEEKRERAREHNKVMADILYCKDEYKEIDGIIKELKQKISEGSTPKLIELLMDATLERYKLKGKVDRKLRERSSYGLGGAWGLELGNKHHT